MEGRNNMKALLVHDRDNNTDWIVIPDRPAVIECNSEELRNFIGGNPQFAERATGRFAKASTRKNITDDLTLSIGDPIAIRDGNWLYIIDAEFWEDRLLYYSIK